jgi:hypothetical protein
MKVDLSKPYWLFNNIEVISLDLFSDYEGFVYRIDNLTNGMFYIGRKYLWSMRTVKGKKRRQRLESDWKKYWSSSALIKDHVKANGTDGMKRTILAFSRTRGDINRLETEFLWKCNALYDSRCYNDSIGNMKPPTPNIIEGRLMCDNLEDLIV